MSREVPVRFREGVRVKIPRATRLAIYFKRLERGTYLWKRGTPPTIDRKSFLMLLEGITPQRIQKRFSLGK